MKEKKIRKLKRQRISTKERELLKKHQWSERQSVISKSSAATVPIFFPVNKLFAVSLHSKLSPLMSK